VPCCVASCCVVTCCVLLCCVMMLCSDTCPVVSCCAVSCCVESMYCVMLCICVCVLLCAELCILRKLTCACACGNSSHQGYAMAMQRMYQRNDELATVIRCTSCLCRAAMSSLPLPLLHLPLLSRLARAVVFIRHSDSLPYLALPCAALRCLVLPCRALH